MRLVCPSCQANYEVPADVIGDGTRRMRCARCQQEWTALEAMPVPPRAVAAQSAALVSPVPLSASPASSLPEVVASSDVARAGANATMLAEHEPGVEEPPPESAKLPPISELQWPPIAVPDPQKPVRDETLRSMRPSVFAAAMLAWGLTVATLFILILTAYIWRGPIMQAWPPSERVYAAIGLR